MNLEAIQRDFHAKVSAKIRLVPEGSDRFRIFTPFLFDDGDHLAVVFKRTGDGWSISDEAHTFMHLTYDIDEKDLQRGTRQKIIDNALSAFCIEDRDGELTLPITDDRYGDALYSFIQALLKISDVTYLSRERVKSTFLEDFRAFMEEQIPAERRQFNWRHPTLDPEGSYPVDCYVNGMTQPLFVFALPNDNKTRDATITLLKFEQWGLDFRSLTIFENQEEINRKVLARFSDVSDKQYSNLTANRARISRYLQGVLS